MIVIGIKVLKEILVTTPSPLYSKHYDQLNTWLLEGAYRLARELQNKGFKALYFPETDPYMYFDLKRNHGEPRMSPSFCHIHSAVASGLGKRGKVGVVLTPQFGPRQRWTTVVTTAKLTPGTRYEQELCLDFVKSGSCGSRCIEVCKEKESGALMAWPDEGGVKQYQCTFADLKAQGLACGRCIAVCPVGKS